MKDSAQTARKTTYYSILINATLAIVKGVAGYSGNSYALIADAIESTTDIFSSGLVLLGLRYANRPADENHPYGHGRIEPLVTFVIVGFLIISAAGIALESVNNIVTPHESPKAWTLLVLVPIIVSKEVSFHLILRKSKQTDSSSLKADAWHHRSDSITSIAAFIGITIAIVLGKGYEMADDWAALLASGFILYNSYRIFRPAFGEIMDEHAYDDLVYAIRNISTTVEGILGTEKCYVRKSGLKYHVDLHALVDKNLTVEHGHEVAHKLKDSLCEKLPQLGHISIHIEPFDDEKVRTIS